MCVVSHSHSHTETVTHHGSQRNDTLPREVSSIGHTTSKEVGAWTANAYRSAAEESAILLHHLYDALCQLRHKIIYIGIVSGQKALFCQDVPSDVKNGIGGTLNTDVDTNHMCFYYFFFHHEKY